MKRHIVILIVVLICTSIFCNYTEDVTENLIKKIYFVVVNKKNSGGTKIILDKLDVPIVNYGYVDRIYIGKQRNPVTVSNKALHYYELYKRGNKRYKQLFLNCADWLVDNSVLYENYAILEYKFPWPRYNISSPWCSGMAQGIAIQALIKAHNLTNNKEYLNIAEKLLNSFFVEIENGGVTYKTLNDGWWYEEYAKKGAMESRVLNGMMFALLGIYEYYEYTRDTKAKYLFEQGIISLKKGLPNYDKNGYSYYDILKNPPREYHKVHIQLLEHLYKVTKEEIFKAYHDRWEKYEKSSFIIQLILNPTKKKLVIFAGNLFFLLLIFEILIIGIKKRKKYEISQGRM